MRALLLSASALLLAATFSPADRELTSEPLTVTIETGSAHTLAISGENAGDITTRRPGNDAILIGMYASERRDRPCELRLHWWRHNNAGSAVDTGTQGFLETLFSECNPNTSSTFGVRVGANGNQTVPYQYGDMYYAAHGIQVCMNRQETRVKGIRLFGSTINQDDEGEVRRDPALQSEYGRANCNTWARARKCPSGEVIVGLEIHHDEVSNVNNVDGVIRGIAPMCAEVTVNTVSGGARSN